MIFFFYYLQAVQISQASPAWQDYIDYIDAIVLDGLKQATLTSLKSMLNNLVQANMAEVGNTHVYALRKFANLFYIKQLKNFQIKKKKKELE